MSAVGSTRCAVSSSASRRTASISVSSRSQWPAGWLRRRPSAVCSSTRRNLPSRSTIAAATTCGIHLSDMNLFPFSGLKIAQFPFADGGTHEAQRRKADLSCNPAHLAVLAFGDDDLDPRGGNIGAKADRRIARPQMCGLVDEARYCRAGDEVAEVDAAAQRFELGLGRCALDLRPVGLRQLVTGIGDATLGRAVIG